MAVCNILARSLLLGRAVCRGGVLTSPWLTANCLGHHPRQLYTPAALGLDQYMKLRQDTAVRYASITDSFKIKMKDLLEKENVMIFTEDFKNILHLTENNKEDLDMVRKMAARFNQQHQGLRFGMYVFGPVVMRTYHYLEQPQEAMEAMQDPSLQGFFDQLITHQLYMDLLLNEGHYQQVLQVFEELQGKRITGVRYPKNCLTLAIAACYKMSTQDSLAHLQGLLEKVKEYGIHLNRRLVVMSATLALNLEHPHIALDLVGQSKSVTHISVRSVKVMSLCQLGRVEEAVLALRAITEIDLPGNARSNRGGHYILREAVGVVEAAAAAAGRKDQIAELKRIVKCLEEAQAISNKSLDEVVCQPIDKFEKRPSGQHRAMLAASFTPTTTTTTTTTTATTAATTRPHRRQGLMDME